MSKSKSSYHMLGDALLLAEGNIATDSYIDISDYGFSRLFMYYCNLALNRYRWENLPDEITSRDIEMALFFRGLACFTYDEDYGNICLQASPIGWDIYRNPNKVMVYGFDYHQERSINPNLDKTNGILIRENDMMFPPVLHLLHYVRLNNETEQTVKMNLGQQRFPVILPKTPNTELSMDLLQQKLFNEFFPCQVVDKKLEKVLGDNLDTVKAINTGVPFLLDKLQDFKHDIESELYTYLGLNNANTDKKERLITDEVNANNGQILMSLDIGFKCREKAVKEINEKYGLDIRVVKVIDEIEEKEVLEDDTDEV